MAICLGGIIILHTEFGIQLKHMLFGKPDTGIEDEHYIFNEVNQHIYETFDEDEEGKEMIKTVFSACEKQLKQAFYNLPSPGAYGSVVHVIYDAMKHYFEVTHTMMKLRDVRDVCNRTVIQYMHDYVHAVDLPINRPLRE